MDGNPDELKDKNELARSKDEEHEDNAADPKESQFDNNVSTKNESFKTANIKLPGIKQLLTKPGLETQEQDTGSEKKDTAYSGSEKADDDKTPVREQNEHSSGHAAKQADDNGPQQISGQLPLGSGAAYPYMGPQLAGFMPSFSMPAQFSFSQHPMNTVPQIPATSLQVPLLYKPQSINQLPNGGLIFSPMGSKSHENTDDIAGTSSNTNGNIVTLTLQQQHQQHMLQQLSAQQQMLQQLRNFIPQQQMMFQKQQKMNPDEDSDIDNSNMHFSPSNDHLATNKSGIVERKKKSLKYKKRYICEICAEKAGVIQKALDGEIHFLDFDPRDPKIVNSKHGKSSIPFSFSTSGHLARHSRLHTGAKNHICPVPLCGKRFGRRDNMRQHYKIHLKKNNDNFSGDLQQAHKQFSGPNTTQANIGQLAMASDGLQNKPPNDNSNYSNKATFPMHEFPRDTQSMMMLQAQQQNHIKQQYIQQQQLAAAQQQMALQAQFGLPYQPLNLNVLAQNANMMPGYAFEGNADSAVGNYAVPSVNAGSHNSHLESAAQKTSDEEQDKPDGKSKPKDVSTSPERE